MTARMATVSVISIVAYWRSSARRALAVSRLGWTVGRSSGSVVAAYAGPVAIAAVESLNPRPPVLPAAGIMTGHERSRDAVALHASERRAPFA